MLPRTHAFVVLLAIALAACNPPPAPPPPSAATAPAAEASATSSPITSAPSAAPSASASVAAADAGPALDIIYIPTPQKIVDKMLEVAKVTKTDVVYASAAGTVASWSAPPRSSARTVSASISTPSA